MALSHIVPRQLSNFKMKQNIWNLQNKIYIYL